jgi:2Fe-2S ferredoxin
MATVRLEGLSGAVRSVDLHDGGAVVDACDTSLADVPFSCRSASCGTCRVVVLEGGAFLTEAEDEELQVLDAFGVTPKKQRLACQAKVSAGAIGLVRLRPVRDDE